MPSREIPWPHAPPHKLGDTGTFYVTASTYERLHHFRSRERLAVLHRGLLKMAAQYGWALEAWAVFSNHYHFVARSPQDASTLRPMLRGLHSRLAGWVNRLDASRGRQVWFQFRETLLTFEKSYLARLNYVHKNAVHHGLVRVASHYPWCSAGCYERTADPAMRETVYGFKIDRVQVEDDFDVSEDW